MKAAEFAYERPKTVTEALALLADPEREATPLAGGQSLMPMMNFRMAQPELLVDLGGLDELCGIVETDGGLRIGAMTRYADLAASPLIATHAPLIALALPHIAHAAIRNRGTIGGSCALADPAAEMPALMLALDAQITLLGAEGGRVIPAQEFFLGMYETALEPGELVVAIKIPSPAPDRRFGFYELARRHGDYAMAGVAVAASGQPGTDYRIAFFSIGERAIRATAAEAALDGLDPGSAGTDAVIADALAEIEFAADLNASAETKRHLAAVVLKRALKGM